jgi:hypothetical protein
MHYNTRGVTRDYKGREVHWQQRAVIEPLIWSQRHESRCDHFLIFRVGIVPTIDENLKMETNFSVGRAVPEIWWTLCKNLN